MDSTKISIIIPVYNMREYILQALDSIEKQTLEEKEIICIDDGSTDTSYEILLEYAKTHNNVTVYHQENLGPGIARNLGIRMAEGEFIGFMDADDFYFSDNALEHLYNLAKRQKVNVCGGSSCNYQYGKITTSGLRPERTFEREHFIKCEDYPGMVGYWAFIYKKNFLIENDIFFPEYSRGQDLPFFVKAIAYAGGAYCSDKIVYVYRREHKKVIYNFDKALTLAKSHRDVFLISKQFKMKKVYLNILNELKGEIGALICRFAAEGNQEMIQILKDFNKIYDANMVDEEFLENGKCLPEDEELIRYVRNNESVERDFLKKLYSANKVYIFGAGNIGKKVLTYLQGNNIRIDSFLVSNIKQNSIQLGNVPVKNVDQIEIGGNDYIIIIAVAWFSQREIIDMLNEKGFCNLYPVDLRRFLLWQNIIEH